MTTPAIECKHVVTFPPRNRSVFVVTRRSKNGQEKKSIEIASCGGQLFRRTCDSDIVGVELLEVNVVIHTDDGLISIVQAGGGAFGNSVELAFCCLGEHFKKDGNL